MVLDEVWGVVVGSRFATGFLVGSLALGVGALVIVAWPRSCRTSVLPLAGLLLVGAAAIALGAESGFRAGLGLGLGLLALAGVAAAAIKRFHQAPATFHALLCLPGAWMVAASAGLDELWPRLLLMATVAVAGALTGAADQAYRRLGLGPVLLLMSLAGAYATLPETQRIVVVLGAGAPLVVLGWPRPLASLGRAGSSAVVGLLAWVAVTDGSTRSGSTVGAIACLGVLVIEPVVRVLLNARSGQRSGPAAADAGEGLAAWPAALPVLLSHLTLVTVAARLAGLRAGALEAAAIAGLALLVVVLLALRWPARLPLAGTDAPGSQPSGFR